MAAVATTMASPHPSRESPRPSGSKPGVSATVASPRSSPRLLGGKPTLRGSSNKTTTTTSRSRGVDKTYSNESLTSVSVGGEENASDERPRSRSGVETPSSSKTSSSAMSNRRRVAMAAADQLKTMNQESFSGTMSLNDSAGSIISTNSPVGRPRSSRRVKAGEKITRRQPASSSSLSSINIDSDDEKEKELSLSSGAARSSRRPGRDSGGSRSKSRSHSKSRSKSAKARNRRPAPSQSNSGSSVSQSVGHSRRPRSGSRDDTLDEATARTSDFIPPISPMSRGAKSRGSGGSGSSSGGGELPSPVHEKELLDFLVGKGSDDASPTNTQRLCRSMDDLDFGDDTNGSGRAARSVGGSRSLRRERTVGSSSNGRTRAQSTRETNSSSTSVYKRPPRSSRGIGRSRSDLDGLLLSPKRSPRPEASGGGKGSPDDHDDNFNTRVAAETSSSRHPPERTKSAPEGAGLGAGDLGEFFSRSATAHISRRKKTSSGNRSVVSMPTRSRRIRLMKTEVDDTKQPSSRTTVTGTSTDTYDSDEDIDDFDDSIAGSEEGDLNDTRVPSSGRSMNDVGDGATIGALDIEAALQMHMSRTENLLFDVFPKHIAEALRSGRKVEPENHECVTIFFSDIVGFTNISSELDPMKVSDLLDRLYNSFDALSHYHDVFKVETIGDAYMAVTNLTKNQRDHCKRIAEFAIDAIRVANQTLVDKDDPKRGFVNIRVGFHSGPVVSNVVGSRNPRFCLFGDTVNTASRMESNSEVNRIHCSGASAELLREQHPALKLNPRGTIEVKGKGEMETFWVNEDAALVSQREGTSRSIFKILKGGPSPKNRQRSNN